MRVWHQLPDVPVDLGRTVVSIGNFDGVHLGHQHVVARARANAARLGIDTVVVVTFDPHPMAVLRPEHAPQTLTRLPHRAELLHAAGADAVLVLPFDRDVAAWSPEEFVDRVLVQGLRAGCITVGANFRFGRKAAGDVALLTELGKGAGFEVDGVALDGGPQVWSSTYVRACLQAGDVAGATEALGRRFAVRGPVTRGDQRGRELGFPTANVEVAGLCVPADGVYAGYLRPVSATQAWPAAISVGTNPTFEGERSRRVEAYVLDRDDLDLYGVEVDVEFQARIRPMVAFEGLDALIKTMHDDVARTRELLS